RSWLLHVFLSFFGERRAWVSKNRAGSHGSGTSFSAFSEKDVPATVFGLLKPLHFVSKTYALLFCLFLLAWLGSTNGESPKGVGG
ncbi:MAG: hypothetical protein IJ771_06400, partial [Clostridia bacterium]|nr:hypothetical protein [Clostridia bacterium]